MIVRIPFQGFYESELNFRLDFEVESDGEHYETDMDDLYDKVDWKKTFSQVSQEYANQWLLETGLDGKFESLQSPRFYNFETDALYVTLPEESLVKIKNKCLEYKEEFSKFVKDQCSSRDGFISFVSNDLEEWLLDDWDEVQYQVALMFIEEEIDTDTEENVIDWLSGNGGFCLEYNVDLETLES